MFGPLVLGHVAIGNYLATMLTGNANGFGTIFQGAFEEPCCTGKQLSMIGTEKQCKFVVHVFLGFTSGTQWCGLHLWHVFRVETLLARWTLKNRHGHFFCLYVQVKIDGNK